jgi:hypothetical protein
MNAPEKITAPADPRYDATREDARPAPARELSLQEAG